MHAASTLARISGQLREVEATVSRAAPGAGLISGIPWRGPAAGAFGEQIAAARAQLAEARWAVEAAAREAYRHEALMRALRAAMAGAGSPS